MSVASIGIKVDAKEVSEATSALNELTDAANRAADAIARLRGVGIDPVRVASLAEGERVLSLVRDARKSRKL